MKPGGFFRCSVNWRSWTAAMFSSWALLGLPDGRKFWVKLILEGRCSWTRIFSVSITAVFKLLIRSGDRQIGWKKRSDSKPWNTHRAILGLEADPGPWRCILRDQQGRDFGTSRHPQIPKRMGIGPRSSMGRSLLPPKGSCWGEMGPGEPAGEAHLPVPVPFPFLRQRGVCWQVPCPLGSGINSRVRGLPGWMGGWICSS